jgi:hypothetical protein
MVNFWTGSLSWRWIDTRTECNLGLTIRRRRLDDSQPAAHHQAKAVAEAAQGAAD